MAVVMISSNSPRWSYVHRPVERLQETPIYAQLVAEATYPQLAEEPTCPEHGVPDVCFDPPDPLVGAP